MVAQEKAVEAVELVELGVSALVV